MKRMSIVVISLLLSACVSNLERDPKSQQQPVDAPTWVESTDPVKFDSSLFGQSSPLGSDFVQIYKLAYLDLRNPKKESQIDQETFVANQAKFIRFYQQVYKIATCRSNLNIRNSECPDQLSRRAEALLLVIDRQIDKGKRDPYMSSEEYFFLDLSNLKQEALGSLDAN